jgi:hypothetical protein
MREEQATAGLSSRCSWGRTPETRGGRSVRSGHSLVPLLHSTPCICLAFWSVRRTSLVFVVLARASPDGDCCSKDDLQDPADHMWKRLAAVSCGGSGL